jgi:uncharacterized protein (DUF1697 family)
MSRYVALLRGINVGGNNLIKMPALKASFEAQGHSDVSTYIQSGNVLFSSDEKDQSKLTAAIEATLSKAFEYNSRIVLRSHDQMRDIVRKAPKGFGEEPDAYRYDVFFLKDPLTTGEAMQQIVTKEGVDQAYPGPGVLYFTRLVARLTSSYASRIVSMPVYQDITIRNWNTTTKLLQLMETAQAKEKQGKPRAKSS